MKVLIIDDDDVFRRHLAKALTRRGYKVTCAAEGVQALQFASERPFDAAIVDMKMPDMDGLRLIQELSRVQPSMASVILTGYGSISNAVEAVRAGAVDYLTKPCKVERIEGVLRGVAARKGLEEEGGIPSYMGIVGISPAIQRVIKTIEVVKDVAIPVLITGETGVGKELVARAIHYDGVRKKAPFVAINCASLKPELLENELFGHVKGAFTGATGYKEGLLKVAHKGTLFIDEIGDMDLTIQASLLRFLEDGTFRPLGGTVETKVDVRVVCALNRDIEVEIQRGRFRQDLYYRLNVCRIHVPPLRERKEDIPILVRYFLDTSPIAKDKKVAISPEAMDLLLSYDYPGNVRELFNILNRALLFCRDVIREEHLSDLRKGHLPSSPASSLSELEKNHILETLKRYNWNISRTARALGIHRRTLQRKMKRYGIR